MMPIDKTSDIESETLVNKGRWTNEEKSSKSLSATHEQTRIARHDVSSCNEKEIRDNVQSSLPMKASKVSGKNTVEELSTDSQPIGNIVSSASTSPKSAKRARRKCIAEGCQNGAVQGGRCISHGAKRKVCAHEVSFFAALNIIASNELK